MRISFKEKLEIVGGNRETPCAQLIGSSKNRSWMGQKKQENTKLWSDFQEIKWFSIILHQSLLLVNDVTSACHYSINDNYVIRLHLNRWISVYCFVFVPLFVKVRNLYIWHSRNNQYILYSSSIYFSEVYRRQCFGKLHEQMQMLTWFTNFSKQMK